MIRCDGVSDMRFRDDNTASIGLIGILLWLSILPGLAQPLKDKESSEAYPKVYEGQTMPMSKNNICFQVKFLTPIKSNISSPLRAQVTGILKKGSPDIKVGSIIEGKIFQFDALPKSKDKTKRVGIMWQAVSLNKERLLVFLVDKGIASIKQAGQKKSIKCQISCESIYTLEQILICPFVSAFPEKEFDLLKIEPGDTAELQAAEAK